jgi:hypothetical protein
MRFARKNNKTGDLQMTLPAKKPGGGRGAFLLL